MFRKGFLTSTSWTVNGDGFAVGNNAEGADFLAKILYTCLGDGAAGVTTTGFQVVKKTGLTCTVKPFFVAKSGYFAWDTAETDITLTSSTSEQVIYVGVRLDLPNNTFAGGVAGRTTFVAGTDLVAAKITIPANAVTLTDGMIEDLRYNTTYCGQIDEYRERSLALIAELEDALAAALAGGVPAHASTHAAGQSDVITPSAINAVAYTSQTLSDSAQTQARTNISAAKAVSGVADAIEAAVVINSQTDNYTVTLADVGKDIWITSSSNKTLTIPLQSSVAFVDKSYFFVTRGGTGTVTIAITAGGGLNSAGSRLKIAEQYTTVMVRRTAQDVWLVTGSLSA